MTNWKTIALWVFVVGVFFGVPFAALMIWPGHDQWLQRWALVGPVAGLYVGLFWPRRR
jgi:hypothetical protein